ncbi:MAG: hypothetical protein L0216_21700 [Planctomycetales bacterium]|nr:hypothetical protein [Planctomycetales bacterium]
MRSEKRRKPLSSGDDDAIEEESEAVRRHVDRRVGRAAVLNILWGALGSALSGIPAGSWIADLLAPPPDIPDCRPFRDESGRLGTALYDTIERTPLDHTISFQFLVFSAACATQFLSGVLLAVARKQDEGRLLQRCRFAVFASGVGAFLGALVIMLSVAAAFVLGTAPGGSVEDVIIFATGVVLFVVVPAATFALTISAWRAVRGSMPGGA